MAEDINIMAEDIMAGDIVAYHKEAYIAGNKLN